ncbi:Aminotran 1 2 domain-containing protein [Citrus sinensis]|uniref:Aminotran 1 2 domain-containing protein n=1 Tax=Citrus sinensis TaxID=2711 RepID=A0ACB8N3K6_CITSI|nr:Aminotran 1 2 domain-containing protein [Citrus sinensis]
MESGAVKKKWGFQVKQEHITATATLTVRSALTIIKQNLKENDPRPIIPLGHGDPSAFPCFRTTPVAEDAVVDAVRSAEFNCYSPSVGILPARRAIAGYLNRDLPCKLSPDDVHLTAGCKQAIQVILTVLARPGANILLPKPGFPLYEANARHTHLEIRHFDLLPEKGWEVDLDGLEALADENTVAMVIVNPGNPCGNVFTYQHLQKIAEKARKLGIMVISDEVYDHLTFGSTPYVRMGVFGSTVPVITLGSMSKRWIVPGWRLGWLVTSDPSGILQELRVDSFLPSKNLYKCCNCKPTIIVMRFFFALSRLLIPSKAISTSPLAPQPSFRFVLNASFFFFFDEHNDIAEDQWF